MIERNRAMKDSARFAVTGYQHTPGPWRYTGHGYVNASDCRICQVGDFEDKELLPFNRKRWEADSRLIAAAPDLLEALKVIVDLPFQFPCGLLEQALDAIEKATGQGKFEEENE